MIKKPAIAIIQARMSSSRLPGKVMKLLADKPIIWHIYKRAEKCQLVDKVIIATSTDRTDDPLAEYCEINNLDCFRGSLNNVLSRFINILNGNNYPYFVRITGDCPLICPQFIDNQIDALIKFDGDITWTKYLGGALLGQGVHSVRSLKYIAEKSNCSADKEHVGSIFLSKNPELFRIVELNPPDKLISNVRLTIDEPKDYILFTEIFNSLSKNDKLIKLENVISWLIENITLIKINRKVQHKKINIETRSLEKTWESIPKVGKANYFNNT